MKKIATTLDLLNNKIINVSDATDANDAVNLSQLNKKLNNIYTASSATPAATVAKTVTVDNWTPTAGDLLAVTFTLGSTVANITLSVNGGAAYLIRINGANVNTTSHTLAAGAMLLLFFDGTYWQSVGSQRTSDSDTYERNRIGGSVNVGDVTTRYKMVAQCDDGLYYPLSIGDTTSTSNIASTRNFLISSPILFYNSTSTLAAGSPSTNFYTSITTSYLQYTFNVVTLTAGKSVYIKALNNNDGTWCIDSSFLTQTLPTTDDGYLYILLGVVSSTQTTVALFEQHPIYEYKNGKLRLYSYDNVAEYTDLASFPATGVSNRIYIATDTNLQYRWNGSSYVGLITASSPTSWQYFFNATYVSDSERYFKIATISAPRDGVYRLYNLHIGKGFYGGQHWLDMNIRISISGVGTSTAPSINLSANGISKNASVQYIHNTTTNLLELYIFTSGGSGSGIAGSFGISLYDSSYTNYVTIYSSGSMITSPSATIIPIILKNQGGSDFTALTGNVQTQLNNKANTSQLTDGSVTKVGTTSVGSTNRPVYINNGVPSSLSATVGNNRQPVFLNAGALTVIGDSVGDSDTPVYVDNGTFTTCNQYFRANTGGLGSVEAVGSKGNYNGITVPGGKRVSLISHDTYNEFGLFSESDGIWMLDRTTSGILKTDYLPALTSNSNEIATTAFVNSRIKAQSQEYTYTIYNSSPSMVYATNAFVILCNLVDNQANQAEGILSFSVIGNAAAANNYAGRVYMACKAQGLAATYNVQILEGTSNINNLLKWRSDQDTSTIYCTIMFAIPAWSQLNIKLDSLNGGGTWSSAFASNVSSVWPSYGTLLTYNLNDVIANSYPQFQDTDISASGTITLNNGGLCKVIHNNVGITTTLSNTPATGTISWIYFDSYGCTSSNYTLNFTDVLGVSRSIQRSATNISTTLPHIIKCTKALGGWMVEWNT